MGVAVIEKGFAVFYGVHDLGHVPQDCKRIHVPEKVIEAYAMCGTGDRLSSVIVGRYLHQLLKRPYEQRSNPALLRKLASVLVK